MINDEFSNIVAASGSVGWYMCPNEHPYTVGSCTWPMETRVCNAEGCDAMIGGHHHIAVDGVTRLDTEDLQAPIKPGYDNTYTLGEKAYELQIHTRASTRFYDFSCTA
jgi:hypothetical protein